MYWNVVEFVGTIVEYIEMCWKWSRMCQNVLKYGNYGGMCWNVLKCVREWCNVLEGGRICWNVVECFAMSWDVVS